MTVAEEAVVVEVPCPFCEGTLQEDGAGCTWCGESGVFRRTLPRERKAPAKTGDTMQKSPGKRTSRGRPPATEKETILMGTMQFVREDEKKGKKFQQVAAMMEALKDAGGEPVPFEKLCEDAGAKYPQDVQAAFFALELAGVVDRYTYTKTGSTRSHVAYALARDEGGEVRDPS